MVKLPLPMDYQMALQAPAVAFVDETLRRGTPRRNPLGLPASISGGFALTFDVTVGRTRYAVRCFHKRGNRLQERYAAVADFIHTAGLDFLVDVDYVPSGIRVGAEVFPIVRMPWVEGTRLDDWIDDNLDKPAALDRVRRNIDAALVKLRQHGVAHGDLQHGNILVRPDGSIRLVDYDGMYLPALVGYGAAEQGHRNYQHPDRGTQFDPSLDLFAGSVIDLSLAALVYEPQLWRDLNKNSGESLLFSAEDFANPEASPVFARLARIPDLAEQVQRLRLACGVNYGLVPSALAGTASPTGERPRSSTPTVAPAPTVIRATDRSALLARQGDHVTVVGRVVAANTIQRAGFITFLNFGNHRRGAFTVVAWERGHRDLVRTFGTPAHLTGSWVSVTGVLSVYTRSGVVTPQIELRNARSIRTITTSEAATMLAAAQSRHAPSGSAPYRHAAAPAVTPTPPTPTPPTSTPNPVRPGTTGRAADLDDRLGRLYSSPAFTHLGNDTGATRATPPPATPPPAPQPSVPPPSTRQPSVPGPIPPSRQSVPPPGGRPAATPGHPTPHIPRTPAPGPSSPLAAHQPPYVPPGAYQPGQSPSGTPSYRPPAPAVTRGEWPIGPGVAALITAIVLGPVGLVLSIVTLAQTSSRREDRLYALAGVAIGVFWMLLCAVAL
ncbi:hypothetical protein ACIBCR_11520 [Micromonospora echinospora]|uniref:hypothetical protein n=1 Tax=Micromonospora echinospora TaxID=1877 RepID=UPI0037B554C0